MGVTLRKLLIVPIMVFGLANVTQASLINGGFEALMSNLNDNKFVQIPETTPGLGWQTTATDNLIELWREPFKEVLAYEGKQFAELNATQVSTLYQDILGIDAGLTVGWEFAHRGRSGNDTLELIITDLGADSSFGTGDDTQLYYGEFTDGNSVWGFYTGTIASLTLGNTIRFAWESISSVGGATYGNFLDAAAFGVGVGPNPVPEPATMLLFGVGLIGLAGLRVRTKKSNEC